MDRQWLLTLLPILLAFPWVHAVPYERAQSCRNLPGDIDWPSLPDWDSLNKTVDGRLVATVPIAASCHGPHYQQELCEELQETWPFADAHVHVPAEFLAPYFQNQSCDPFTGQDVPCELGNYAHYSINVSSVDHIRAGIRFARAKNVRLTIKNSGHDLLGKSTGKGALSLWMHNMNAIDFIGLYNGTANYTGPAVRLSAGVLTSDAISTASDRGYRIVTGTCPDVGVAGGYTAGGGHGAFTSKYGMAADSVLEWEVVTAEGEHVVATPTSNADLYWALSGGGPGTFGVVVSMVTRVYQDGPMGGASLSFNAETAGGIDEFWNGVAAFQSALGQVTDAGAVVSYAIVPNTLYVYGIGVDGNASVIDKALEPVLFAMSEIGISLNITTTTHPNFLDFFNQYFSQVISTTPQAQITGGRLVPRSIMESFSGSQNVTEAFRNATDTGFSMVCDAVNADQPHINDNAVLPAWRSSLLHCIIVRSWNFTMPRAQMAEYQKTLTEVVMPLIESVTPGGGAYLNEANFAQPEWQSAFYGANYPRLREIKDAVDPLGLFYAQTAVGSDAWAEDGDGRLCRV